MCLCVMSIAMAVPLGASAVRLLSAPLLLQDMGGYGGSPDGFSSGETPASEKARALELTKLAHDPSPTIDAISAKPSLSPDGLKSKDADAKAALDDVEITSSGETPDSEKARALELAKLDWDPFAPWKEMLGTITKQR